MSNWRFDRFATLSVYSRFKDFLSHTKTRKIPILMYHSISDISNTNKHPYFEINTSRSVFENHLKYLRENNYEPIRFDKLFGIENIFHEEKKYVLITFDDGYADFYDHAFPILEKYRFTAYVFLIAGFIDNHRATLNGKKFLGWREIRELRSSGIYFGSHTVQHLLLKDMTLKEVRKELSESKLEIEDRIGEGVDSFAYPYAFPEHRTEFVKSYTDILLNTGYRYGVTTKIGRVSLGDHPHLLKRLPVNSFDDINLFHAKMCGDYDWVGKFQSIYKRIKT